ncbi:MAG: histidine phosphatase family protein [Nocardioides sp.]
MSGDAETSVGHSGWSARSASPIRVLIARHGATPLSHEKRFSGSGADPALDDIGRAQVDALSALLGSVGTVDRSFTSPLLRARQTAFILAQRHGFEPVVAPALRELDFGDWEGLTFAEAAERDPQGIARWAADAEEPTGGAEAMADVGHRVTAWLDATLCETDPGSTVLLVTHVTPIKCLVASALGAPWEALFRMELAPASLSEIAYVHRDGEWVASLRGFNRIG